MGKLRAASLTAHTPVDIGQLLPPLHLLFPGKLGWALPKLRGGATGMPRPWWLGLLLLVSPTLHSPGLNTPSSFQRDFSPSPLELLPWEHGLASLDSLGGQA